MKSTIAAIGCLLLSFIWIQEAANAEGTNYRAITTSGLLLLTACYLGLGEFLKKNFPVFKDNIFTRQIGTGHTNYNKNLGNILFYTVASYSLEFVFIYSLVTGEGMPEYLPFRLFFYLAIFIFTVFSLYMSYALFFAVTDLVRNKE